MVRPAAVAIFMLAALGTGVAFYFIRGGADSWGARLERAVEEIVAHNESQLATAACVRILDADGPLHEVSLLADGSRVRSAEAIPGLVDQRVVVFVDANGEPGYQGAGSERPTSIWQSASPNAKLDSSTGWGDPATGTTCLEVTLELERDGGHATIRRVVGPTLRAGTTDWQLLAWLADLDVRLDWRFDADGGLHARAMRAGRPAALELRWEEAATMSAAAAPLTLPAAMIGDAGTRGGLRAEVHVDADDGVRLDLGAAR